MSFLNLRGRLIERPRWATADPRVSDFVEYLVRRGELDGPLAQRLVDDVIAGMLLELGNDYLTAMQRHVDEILRIRVELANRYNAVLGHFGGKTGSILVQLPAELQPAAFRSLFDELNRHLEGFETLKAHSEDVLDPNTHLEDIKVGLEEITGAEEIRVTPDEYARRLRHVVPSQSLDVALSTIEDIGQSTAAAILSDTRFVQACRDGNWTLAGTLFHAEAARQGRALAAAGLHGGYQMRFELAVQPGKGGSRLDTFIEGPGGEIIEVDWKTTGRSAISYGSRREMVRHARHVTDNLGVVLTQQLSKSWVDFVRPSLPDIDWPR